MKQPVPVAEADLVGSPRPFFTLTEQWGLLGGLVGLVAWLFAFGKHRNLKNGRDEIKQSKKNKKKQHNNKLLHPQKEGVVVELCLCLDHIVL